jgi:uncharacterized membrane protein YfcA
LLGLGGAAFRLPLLVTLFRYPLRRAVALNLAISFVAVVVAAARWALAKQAPIASVAAVTVCTMPGVMAGAALGARWLVSIGLLLITESATPWISAGLSIGPVGAVW